MFATTGEMRDKIQEAVCYAPEPLADISMPIEAASDGRGGNQGITRDIPCGL